jgi:hypothetical protein
VLRITAEALPTQLRAWEEEDAERERIEAGAAAVMDVRVLDALRNPLSEGDNAGKRLYKEVSSNTETIIL